MIFFLKVKFRIVQGLNDNVATGTSGRNNRDYNCQSQSVAASVQKEKFLNRGFKTSKENRLHMFNEPS